MRLHIGSNAFNSLKLTDYLEEEEKSSLPEHIELQIKIQQHKAPMFTN